MPRVNPYKPHYGGDPTASAILLPLTFAVAVIIAILAFAPQIKVLQSSVAVPAMTSP